ncbi:MAG: hypothetical protein RLY21_1656 [Planctomycetota bacterium]
MTTAEHDDSTSPDDARSTQRGGEALPEMRALLVPRGLVMLAALWVFFAWVMLFGFRPPVQPQAASYGPTLEILFAVIGVGIAVGWPLLRLSARPSSAPILQPLFDAFALFILMQVVVWPLRLVSNWTLPRTWLVVGALAVALAVSGAIMSFGLASSDRRARTRTMVAVLVAALLPIAVLIVGEAIAPTGSPVFSDAQKALEGGSWRPLIEWAVPASAPVLLGRCAEAIPLDPNPAEWALLRNGGIVALALWVLALLWRLQGARKGHRPDTADPLS